MTRQVVAFGEVGDIDVDAAFSKAIAGSGDMAVLGEVLLDGVTLPDKLNLTGGSVTADRTQSILSSCNVTIADPLRVPVSPEDVLTPYGYELRLWRGVSVPGGQLMAPLGVFPIQRSSVDGVTLLSSLTCQDRSKLVSDAIFEDTYQVASGTNYATAIQEMVEDAVTGIEFLFPSTSFTTPLLTFTPDNNRWAAVQAMARSIGNEVLFDGLGRCVMRPEPTFQDAPGGVIAEGENMLGATMALDRGPAYNQVIATSANASNGDVFRGEATDDDPSSPTYFGGPFGKKGRRYSSPFIASTAQAESAAAAILASNLGVAKSVNVSVLPDPRREPSDVVQVTRSTLGLDELHIADLVTTPLAATSPMTARVRAQQVAA